MRLRTAAKMARSLTWGGGAAERFRAVVLSLAAAAVVIVGCGAVSGWLMSERVSTRLTNRNFAPAQEGAEPTYERAVLYDETPRSQQLMVMWWRLADDAAPPPGLPSRSPGWYVSPALADLIRDEPGIGRRFPNHQRLGEAAVGHADELLAYRLVDDPSVELDERLSSSRTGVPWGEGAELETLPALLAGVGLVGVPGGALLGGALALASPQRDRRSSLLRFLGVPDRDVGKVLVLDGLCGALPGAVGGAVAWVVLSPSFEEVPFVGRPCFAGDLALPLPVGLAVAGGVLGLVAVLARLSLRRTILNRPAARVPAAPHPRRLLAVGAGSALVAVGVFFDSAPPVVMLSGVVLTVVGLPLAMSQVLFRLGNQMAHESHRGGLVRLLAGRSLSLEAADAARTLGPLVAVTAFVPLLTAWVAVARSTDEPRIGPAVVEVSGIGEGTARELAARHDLSFLVVESQPEADEPPTEVRAVGDCTLWAAQLPDGAGIRCAESSGRVVMEGVNDLAYSVTTSPPPGFRDGTFLFVFRPGSSADNEFRAVANNATTPSVRISSSASFASESPLVAWILGAASLAAGMAAAAIAVHLLGNSQRSATSRVRLGAAGATRGQVRRIVAGEAALSVLAAGAVGTVVGAWTVIAFTFLEPVAKLDAEPFAALSLVVGLLATVASASAAVAAPEPADAWSERQNAGW